MNRSQKILPLVMEFFQNYPLHLYEIVFVVIVAVGIGSIAVVGAAVELIVVLYLLFYCNLIAKNDWTINIDCTQ